MLTIKNAQKLIEDYKHLIGMEFKGSPIDALIIMPRNDPEFSEAERHYRRNIEEHGTSIIYPAKEENGYIVMAIFRRKFIKSSGELYRIPIFEILSFHQINIVYSDYGINL